MEFNIVEVICMKCAAKYEQKLDPLGNIYPINVYMCGVCASREIYVREDIKNAQE